MRHANQLLMKLISVSIGQKTQKVAYLFHSFQVPRCFTPQKKFISPSECLLERLLPPHRTASSLHWLLLYVIEIETSIKMGLLLCTKEADILE